MQTNCYDVDKTLVIVGSCLERMQPIAYKKIKEFSDNIYTVCLEFVHLNMVITKLIAMICRAKIDKIIFATVDDSPHCVQLHYIEHEIRKAMNLDNIKVYNYVAVNNNLIEISSKTLRMSKSLSTLEIMK